MPPNKITEQFKQKHRGTKCRKVGYKVDTNAVKAGPTTSIATDYNPIPLGKHPPELFH